MTKSGLKLPVYMDYQSTTPVDPRVIQKMNDVLIKKTYTIIDEKTKLFQIKDAENRSDLLQGCHASSKILKSPPF